MTQQNGDWMYTGPRATAAHWCTRSVLTGERWGLCGVYCEYGTGSHTEYDRATALRACPNCRRRGAPEKVTL
jgi:hypothetical protein